MKTLDEFEFRVKVQVLQDEASGQSQTRTELLDVPDKPMAIAAAALIGHSIQLADVAAVVHSIWRKMHESDTHGAHLHVHLSAKMAELGKVLTDITAAHVERGAVQ